MINVQKLQSLAGYQTEDSSFDPIDLLNEINEAVESLGYQIEENLDPDEYIEVVEQILNEAGQFTFEPEKTNWLKRAVSTVKTGLGKALGNPQLPPHLSNVHDTLHDQAVSGLHMSSSADSGKKQVGTKQVPRGRGGRMARIPVYRPMSAGEQTTAHQDAAAFHDKAARNAQAAHEQFKEIGHSKHAAAASDKVKFHQEMGSYHGAKANGQEAKRPTDWTHMPNTEVLDGGNIRIRNHRGDEKIDSGRRFGQESYKLARKLDAKHKDTFEKEISRVAKSSGQRSEAINDSYFDLLNSIDEVIQSCGYKIDENLSPEEYIEVVEYIIHEEGYLLEDEKQGWLKRAVNAVKDSFKTK